MISFRTMIWFLDEVFEIEAPYDEIEATFEQDGLTKGRDWGFIDDMDN